MLDQFAADDKADEIVAMEQLEFISTKLSEHFEASTEFIDELAEEYYTILMK